MSPGRAHRSWAPLGLACLSVTWQPLRALAQQPADSTHVTASLGVVSSAGNAEETTVSLGDKLTRVHARWTLRQEFKLVYGRADSTTKANFYRAALRARFAATPRLSPLAYAEGERDTPAGLSYHFEEGVGAYYLVLNQPRNKLALEVGPTLVHERRLPLSEQDFAAGRAAATYERSFASNAAFDQVLEYLPDLMDLGNYRINSETTLSAPVAGILALELAYEIRYVNHPSAGRKRSDRFLTAGIQVKL